MVGIERDAVGVTCQESQQRHVVDLGAHAWADAELFAAQIERQAHLVVAAGQEEGQVREVVGEPERPRRWSTDDAHRLAGDAAAPPGIDGARMDALVAEHEVE